MEPRISTLVMTSIHFILSDRFIIKSYSLHGNATNTQTYELAVFKGTATYGSAGDWALTQIGSTQSLAMTAGRPNKLEETGLSVSLSAGDQVIPFWRRSTTATSGSYYIEGILNFVFEKHKTKI